MGKKGKSKQAAEPRPLEDDELEEGSHDDGVDGEEIRSPKQETLGQLKQRHKREMKQHKDAVKRMGKNRKDEVAALEEAIKKRHEDELAAAEAATAEAEKEEGDGDTEGQGQGAPDGVVQIGASLYATALSDETSGKKLTKAQKRRQKLAEQEAERAARIEAEQAELGDTDRMIEDRALWAILREEGLRIHDIQPDGHCLFRSLEHQLRTQDAVSSGTNGSAPAANSSPDRPSFQALREQATTYMLRNRPQFEPFWMADSEDGETFEEYCNNMASTGMWGGELELRALAEVLKRHIVVYSVALKKRHMGEQFRENGPPLLLSYHEKMYSLGAHYNSVVEGVDLAGAGKVDVADLELVR